MRETPKFFRDVFSCHFFQNFHRFITQSEGIQSQKRERRGEKERKRRMAETLKADEERKGIKRQKEVDKGKQTGCRPHRQADNLIGFQLTEYRIRPIRRARLAEEGA
jgi:hypothetical protein